MSDAAVSVNALSLAAADTREHLSPNQQAWRGFRRNRPAIVSSALLGVLVLLVVLWPLWRTSTLSDLVPRALTFSPTELTDEPFSAPNPTHWLGTDANGRDILSRMFYGARISLVVGLVGAGVSLVIGVLWGAVAGYVGGRVDNVMMRIVDILYCLPSIIFVVLLMALVENQFRAWLSGTFSPQLGGLARMLLLFIGLGAVSWLTMARIVRGQVLSLRTRQFVHASRSLGAGTARILRRHILPNVYGIIIVYVTLTIPSIILYESFLSFLGLGIRPPQASLGWLISEGALQINPIRIYWWMILYPAGLLGLTLLALNFVGDGLRDAWDPRTKE
ncbi:MAG: ABC transporter permease [Verrucomicrobia subdivision 3 bacterium]|nr:ABC transporter permease [Limisphaerales bacterium]